MNYNLDEAYANAETEYIQGKVDSTSKDSISRKAMFEILPLYGIAHSIDEAIAGILEGDTLAPFLFIVVLNYVLPLSLDNVHEKSL